MQKNGSRSDEAGCSSTQAHDLLAFNKIDKTDYYALLGIDRAADLAAIRKAYKKVPVYLQLFVAGPKIPSRQKHDAGRR